MKTYINKWRVTPWVASGAFWAVGFMLLPEFMPFVFLSLVGLIGLSMVISVIGDIIAEQKRGREMRLLQDRCVALGSEIEQAERAHGPVTHLREERVAIMAQILNGGVK